MRAVYWLLAGCFLTASFDIILIVDIGGSIRISQLFLGFVCLAALARVIQKGRILWPRGGTALALWTFSQLLFLPLSGMISIGIKFFALLAFTVIGVFAVVQLYGRSRSLAPLMRVYLASYVAVGIFGLVQFALPLLGGPAILVQQWLLHGKLARINGFSYEPSYYVTYLTLGWIMLVELRISKAQITRGRVWKWATVLVTVSLVLSSSKTAWVFMTVELLARVLPYIWARLGNAVRQASQGRMVMRLPGRRATINAILILVVVLASGNFFLGLINPAQLLNGTGLDNTAAHSLNDRNDAAIETLDAFRDHPFVGRSLGGVPIYRAARNGIEVRSMDQLRAYWGFPVLLDVLVASGIIGFIPFLIFLYANTFGALKIATRYWPSERAKWLRALARAMIFEWLLLLVDQNLLRVYVWFHFSMVSLIAYNLEFGDAPETSMVTATSPSLPLLEATSNA